MTLIIVADFFVPWSLQSALYSQHRRDDKYLGPSIYSDTMGRQNIMVYKGAWQIAVKFTLLYSYTQYLGEKSKPW